MTMTVRPYDDRTMTVRTTVRITVQPPIYKLAYMVAYGHDQPREIKAFTADDRTAYGGTFSTGRRV